jgi:enoyl-CoA hydratase/carnithine racemase
MTTLIERTDEAGCATLTLNRPEKLNALNVAVFGELAAHVAALEQETDRIGAVVVRGAGRCFSAGHDLADLKHGEALPRENFQAHVIERLENLPQPVIMAVHGHCYTGALELALAGDLIFAAESARFADTHAKWSLVPIWGLSQRLPRRVGAYKAREMMLTCRTYGAREALAMNLAQFCVAEAEFDRELRILVDSILRNSWHSNRANKRLLLDTDGVALKAGLAHEVFRGLGFGPDFQQRIDGFLNKTAR